MYKYVYTYIYIYTYIKTCGILDCFIGAPLSVLSLLRPLMPDISSRDCYFNVMDKNIYLYGLGLGLGFWLEF
jgi:hypothetical protein